MHARLTPMQPTKALSGACFRLGGFQLGNCGCRSVEEFVENVVFRTEQH